MSLKMLRPCTLVACLRRCTRYLSAESAGPARRTAGLLADRRWCNSVRVQLPIGTCTLGGRETRELADQVDGIGRMDAVIHNAGVYLEPSRSATAERHAKTLAVNTLAPYMLTALIDRPDRLIYLSSGLHHAGAGSAATDDLELGYLTQTRLAVSNDAAATVSGGYWYHQQRQEPAAQARDLAFQSQLTDRLAALTGVAIF